MEGQTKCEPLDDELGGYYIIEKLKHKNERVGHMGLVLLRDPHSGNIWTYDLLCPLVLQKEQNVPSTCRQRLLQDVVSVTLSGGTSTWGLLDKQIKKESSG
jgi:hypothetical protein